MIEEGHDLLGSVKKLRMTSLDDLRSIMTVASSPNRDHREIKQQFSSHSDYDMLVWLETLAMNLHDLPYNQSPMSVEEHPEFERAMRSKTRNLKAQDTLSSVPIGPNFQAEIPELIGLLDTKSLYDDNDLRWLGTQIWPIKGEKPSVETTMKTIGKGRPTSCSCISPRSIGCVRYHISESRLRLQKEIGYAFWSWKFDEMGEFASKSWTLEEQTTFKSLMKTNQISSRKNVVKLALKYFPDKCHKSIISYYYNVFILRRMSLQTRALICGIDSDDD